MAAEDGFGDRPGAQAEPGFDPNQSVLIDSDAASAAAEQIEALQRECQQCEQEGRYRDADAAKRRLEVVRREEEERRRREQSNFFAAERAQRDEEHARDIEEFNAFWDQKVEEFEQHSTSVKDQLADRHRKDFEKEKEKLETDVRTPSWSKHLLNMRKIEATLAKQKNYAEAAIQKDDADKMEEKERKEWEARRQLRIQTHLDKFQEKQRLEMAGLLKRIASGRSEQAQARKTEMEQKIQRYLNLKTQLENKHKIQAQRHERLDGYPTSPTASSVMLRPGSRMGLA